MENYHKIFATILLITLIQLNFIWSENLQSRQNNQNRGPVYKLTYFNLRARAEFIRWMFIAANQSYQDFRIEDKDWPKLKPTFPFQQLPVLDVSDRSGNITIAQSGAIARLLAGRFNMSGKNDIEAAYAHMYSDQLTDLFDEYSSALIEYMASNNSIILNNLLNQTVPRNMKFFDDRLSKNNGFLAGSSLSYADLQLSAILDLSNDQKDTLLKNYPNIASLDNRVRRLPAIANWIRIRPKTDF